MYQSYSHLCCSHCQDLRLRSRGAGLRQDAYGSPLTFSGGDSDTLMLALLRATYSGRNNAALAASVEQALPVQPAWLNFNRLRLRAERSVPIGAGVSAQLCGKGAHPPPPPSLASRPPPGRCSHLGLHFLHPVPRPSFPAPSPPPSCRPPKCWHAWRSHGAGQQARPRGGGLGQCRPAASRGGRPPVRAASSSATCCL